MMQRIYLLLAAVLMGVVSQCTLATYMARVDAVVYELGCWNLTDAAGQAVSGAPWALMVLAVVVVLLSLFTLFLVFYQNYALQKRMTIFSMLVTLGFLVTFAGFYFYYGSQLEAVSSHLTIWSVVPLVVMILQFMAFLSIRKKEADVLAEAANFRLR